MPSASRSAAALICGMAFGHVFAGQAFGQSVSMPGTLAANQADAPSSPDGESHVTLNAAPEGQAAPSTNTLSPICTDRPTKSNYACTVDEGAFQYESDIVNGSFLHVNGASADTYLILNPTVKYGLTSNVDVEANFSPAEIITTRDAGGGSRTIGGISDLYLRIKYMFINADGGDLQITLLPYLKAPTARTGIGNGVFEGGTIMPVNYKLSSLVTLTVDPEVDFLKDSNGGGRHVNTAQLVNLGLSLPGNITLYGELWGDWNFDPAGTTRQYSADTAIAYGLSSTLQLDAGINVGLNRDTPAIQAYVGISQKF